MDEQPQATAALKELDTQLQETPYGAFTAAQMREALGKVQNREDWRFPFKAVIPVPDLPCLAAATEYFHATQLQVVVHPDGWAVESDGYQAW